MTAVKKHTKDASTQYLTEIPITVVNHTTENASTSNQIEIPTAVVNHKMGNVTFQSPPQITYMGSNVEEFESLILRNYLSLIPPCKIFRQ